jgi:uncharacterized protein (TIGR02594 family)
MTIETLVGDKLYRQGSSGPVVQAFQLGLRAIGYKLSGTGNFLTATNTAVRDFQRVAGLMVDGVVGKNTARAIDVAVSKIRGSTGAVIDISDHISVPVAQIQRPLWLQAGLALVGTKEFAGAKDNPVIIDWAKDEGGDIAKSYTHDSIAWCALFGNHVLTKVGLEGPETLWALDFNPELMQKRVGHSWPAVQISGPAVGAFAPMLRDGGGHITIVAGKDQRGNIMGLGGNQSDAVTIAPFAVSRLNKGYWWPAGVPLPDKIGLSHLPIITSTGKVSSQEA